MRIAQNGWGFILLAASLSLYTTAWADVNTVNDSPIVGGGNYFNTPDSKTTFKNSSGGGLWLKGGSNVRGVEVNSTGALTNNGGTIHFYAPGNVVRLDGNVDVRGIRNQSGAYLGNGGNVFVDSAYLYQSGNIYANGINGGLVQFNVGSATLAGNARIEAKGSVFGKGGIVAINASGPVDIQRQVVVDTTGRVSGTFDSNIINIEGGLVNVEGVLKANGFVNREDASGPGGTIRLVSTGQTDLAQTQQALQKAVNKGTFIAGESTAINNRLNALKSSHDGDINIAARTTQAPQAIIMATGGSGISDANDPTDPTTRAGDGGTIIMTAQRHVKNGGWVLANGGNGTPQGPMDDPGIFTNGGNGGTISINAGQNIINSGRTVTDGGNGGISIDRSQGLDGGDGGLIAFSYGNTMQNSGVVRANGGVGATLLGEDTPNQGTGGNGGLVVFSGLNNPSLNGIVVTYGGAPGGPTGNYGQLGSIVTPNPTTATNRLIGVWRRTEPLELLTHHENLILLGNRLPIDHNIEVYLENFFEAWVRFARLRSVADPVLSSFDRGPALDEFGSKLNIDNQESVYPYRNFVFANSMNRRILFFDPHQLSRNFSEISMAPFNTMTILHAGYMGFGSSRGGVQATQFGNGMGGGRFSLIAANFGQINPIYVNGGFAGGSMHMAAAGQLSTGGALGPLLNKHLSTGGTFHGGSIIQKAGRNLLSLNSGAGLMQANGGVAGGNVQLLSQNNLSNFGTIQANGGHTGGSILLQALNQLSNYSDTPKRLEANGGAYGGFIKLKAAEILDAPPGFVPIQLQATGGIQNGQTVTEP